MSSKNGPLCFKQQKSKFLTFAYFRPGIFRVTIYLRNVKHDTFLKFQATEQEVGCVGTNNFDLSVVYFTLRQKFVKFLKPSGFKSLSKNKHSANIQESLLDWRKPWEENQEVKISQRKI